MTYHNGYNNYLVDSHCHLSSINLSEFNNDLDNVINQACAANVKKMLNVCLDLDDVPTLRSISSKYPQVFYSVGVHPTECLEKNITTDLLLENTKEKQCIAIGETGLDYYHVTDSNEQKIQQKSFIAHIEAAIACKKPLIIHTRNAALDTIECMRTHNANKIAGVMHCFSEDLTIAKMAIDLGFYISFSGIVTFKNATVLQHVASNIPLDRILIETDAPYLAPVPFRGKQNHPALVKETALFLANLRQIDYNDFVKITTDNFHRCFFRV